MLAAWQLGPARLRQHLSASCVCNAGRDTPRQVAPGQHPAARTLRVNQAVERVTATGRCTRAQAGMRTWERGRLG